MSLHKEKNVTLEDVRAAYAKYVALRNTWQESQKPEPFPTFPTFPTGGDPKLEVFNMMSRILEDRTTMIAEAEQVGERRAALRHGSSEGRL